MSGDVIAAWSIQLNVDCPHCENWFDILDDWSEQEMWGSVEIGETKVLDSDFEVTCPKCKKDFKITETQH